MKKISIKEIAQITGTSPSTVSTVLNGKAKKGRISDALAQKILTTAKTMGYTPNQVAVSLRTGQSKIIGLIVEDISNIFYAQIASVIEEELKNLGYRIVYCSTKNDRDNGAALIDMLYQRQVDGFIITPVEGMEASLSILQEERKPLILIDRYLPKLNLSHVLVDDKKGVQVGMDHLLEKGYRKIGFVTVDLGQVEMNYREKAYKEFVAEHAMPGGDGRFLKVPYMPEIAAMSEHITHWVGHRNELDALFFATNYLCIAGLQSLQQLGRKIPDDIAVLCFDDHDIFALYPPGITAIRQPIKEIGEKAVALLMQQVESRETQLQPSKLLLPGHLILRGST